MGRHKPNKPRQPHSGREQSSREWFGTAFHSVHGMYHLDVRQSGNGILLTASPAEADDAPAAWPLRLRNDDGGQGLRDLGTALATGQAHGISMEEEPGYKTALMFIPNHPEEGIGMLARVRTIDGQDDVIFERRVERPMGLWAEAGESLCRIALLLGPDAPPAEETEDCLLWPGCYRPVDDSSSPHNLIGPNLILGLCRLCAEGTTLRSLRQADVPISAQQRAVLETVAAAMG
ncbi:hypothetical protein [Streptomyces sp. NPDC053560]|uniref:hypothetical protein n=1 Tax=Streptomyces sp. NPDC053560 TaxID=3365711 RepID=UPI0037CE1C9D